MCLARFTENDRKRECVPRENLGDAFVFSASGVNAYVFGDENSMCLKCVSDVFVAQFAFVIRGCVRRYML